MEITIRPLHLENHMRSLLLFIYFLVLLSDVTVSQHLSIDRAHQLMIDGYLEEALDVFNEIEKDNDKNEEFYFLRGSCLSELGQNDEAIADLSISIELDETNPDAYYQRGFAYFTTGNSAMALLDFDRTIALSPDYGEAYLNRGSVQYDLGNLEEACHNWQKALDTGLTLAQALVDQLCTE